MREDIIKKTEQFMISELLKAEHFKGNTRRSAEYRIEHSFRVARIAGEIAEAEGLDQERLMVTALLHDIGYSKEYEKREDGLNHGRVGAAIARPFLLGLGYSAEEVNEMCYGIAIHVDDKADFDGERNAFTLSIQDADNIDRFDAYRLYEGLASIKFETLPLAEQKAFVEKRIARLLQLREEPFGTETAIRHWHEKIDYQIGFFRRLQDQLENSEGQDF